MEGCVGRIFCLDAVFCRQISHGFVMLSKRTLIGTLFHVVDWNLLFHALKFHINTVFGKFACLLKCNLGSWNHHKNAG